MPTLLSPSVEFLAPGEFDAVLGGTGLATDVAAAATEAAVGAATLDPLLIIGGGIGAAIALEAILNNLHYTGPRPQLRQSFGGGDPAHQSDVTYTYQYQPQTDLQTRTTRLGNPILGVYNQRIGNSVEQGLLHGASEKTPVFSNDPAIVIHSLQIVNVVDVSTGQTTYQNPTYNLGLPQLSPLIFPTTINPGTGLQPLIITPTVIPNEQTNPTVPEEQKVPYGITVKVPEAGLQYQFTPAGVAITNYVPTLNANQGLRFTNIIQPPQKPATEECPCPPCNVDLTKIECILGELEKGLLDDGYDYTVHGGPSGNSGTQSITTDEPYSVSFAVTSKPTTARIESGGTGSPQVVFSGWWSQIINGSQSQRIPIHYEQTTFLLEKAASGYCYCFYVGFDGTSGYTTRKRRDFHSTC